MWISAQLGSFIHCLPDFYAVKIISYPHFSVLLYKKECLILTRKLKIATVFTVIAAIVTAFSALFAKPLGAFLYSEQNLGTVICIDAGHGGIDNGVYGITSGMAEAKINLEIARYLKTDLEALGFSVVLTRENDDGLYGDTSRGFKRRDMTKRKEIATKCNAKIVVSIHCNYNLSKTAKGIAVYYNPSDELSTYTANEFAKKLTPLSAKNVRLDKEKMFMTYDLGLPAVLIECGFLSNAEDEKLLLDENYKKKLSKEMAKTLFGVFLSLE